MKRIAMKVLGWAVALGWLAMFVCGFMAYMVTTYDKGARIVTDGLGRRLYDAPLVARILLLGSHSWAGLGWFLADYVIFWSFVGLTVGARNLSEKMARGEA